MNPFSREIMPVVMVALLFGGVAVSSAYSREKKHAGSDVREMVKVLDNIVNSPDSFPGLNGHARIDSLPAEDVATRYSGLTDKDFEMVAQELGVEIPAIKAVVVIEAGSQMKGFWAPGVPIINFDNATFSRFRRKQSGKGTRRKPKCRKICRGMPFGNGGSFRTLGKSTAGRLIWPRSGECSR